MSPIFQPETASPDPTVPILEQAGVTLPVPGGLVNTATGAAGALAGWAISSIGKRVSIPLSPPSLRPSLNLTL